MPQCLANGALLLANCTPQSCATFGLVCEQTASGPACVPLCAPDCQGKLCGSNGCGGSCGECPHDGECDSEGAECSCVPQCLPANSLLLANCETQSCGTFGLVCQEEADGPACLPL